jgi:NADH-quinone oxidoreductase subunit J
MDTLSLFIKIGIYVLMAVSVIAAIGVVTLRNLFHSALALVAVLLGVAGIYIVLHAEFLAMVQILIYVGAVMTLVIFAIMLTERMSDKSIQQNNQQSLPAFLAMTAFLIFIGRVFRQTPWPVNEATVNAPVTTFDLAKALLGPYVFPFEVISVVLIAALIGALVIAKKDKEPVK